jgi:branched-chain amino acid transport system substrate-binding protein
MRKIFLPAVYFSLSMLLLSSCGGSSSSDSLQIGVLTTDTGDLASFGPAVRASLAIAESEIPQKLEEQGTSISLKFVFADTATDPATALLKIKELKEQGIRFFIGPMSSSEIEAVQEYATANDLVLISPSSTSETLSKSDDFILRTTAPDRGQAVAIAAALQFYGTRFYCPIWRADDFGDDLTLLVGREFQKRGGNFAPGSRYPSGTTDFTEALRQLEVQLDAYVDFFGQRSAAVYAIAFDEIFGLITQASARPFFPPVRWYGSDGIALNTRVLENSVVGDFIRKTELLSPIFAGDRSAPDYERIRSEIQSVVGQTVRPYALMAYDAALLLATVGAEVPPLEEQSSASIVSALIEVSKKTVGATGNLSMDSNGDRMPGQYEYWKVITGEDGLNIWKLGGILNVPSSDYSGATFTPVE